MSLYDTITNQPYLRELESSRGENICNASSMGVHKFYQFFALVLILKDASLQGVIS